MAKGLVTLLGGDITLDSALGKGTTVTITVPQAIDQSTCPPEQEPVRFFAPCSPLACPELAVILMDNSDHQQELLLELMLKQDDTSKPAAAAVDATGEDTGVTRNAPQDTPELSRETNSGSGPSSGPVDARPALLENLQKLLRLLSDDDAASCQLFTSLEPRLAPIDNHAVNAAAKALAAFDFPEAHTLLTPMLNGLKAAHDGREPS